jgi:predicted molibdopterin-dependent oxidoreductase YjgC
VPTAQKVNARYPLILTTGRILSQYNVGAQTRRTETPSRALAPAAPSAISYTDGRWLLMKESPDTV